MQKDKSEMANGTRVGKMMASSDEYQPTEEDLAYKGWKHFIPFRTASKNPKVLPLMAAGPLNYATGHWLNSIIYKARKEGLTEDDIYDTPWRDSAGLNAERFEKCWNEELAKHGKEKASVARAVIRMIRTRLISAVALIFMFGAFGVLSPMLFLNEFLEAREREGTVAQTTMYALLLLLCMTMYSLCFSCAWGIGYTSAIRVRGGVLSFVFKKIVKEQMQNRSVGELVNLCANDGMRLFSACLVGVFAMGSITSLVGAGYSVFLVGSWGLLGFATFFCLIPFQVILSKLIFKLRRKVIPVTDERVKLMSEIVTSIKLVKMYAWEKSFAEKINDIRVREKKILSKSLIVQSLSLIFPQSVAIFASAFTFLAMTCTGANLSVTQAFVFLSLLNSLKFSLGILPFAVKSIAEGKQACDRMKALLITQEEKLKVSAISDFENLVEMRGGYFGWPVLKDNTTGKEGKDGKSLVNGNVKAAKNGGPKHKMDGALVDTELQPLDNEKEDIVVILKDVTMSLKDGTLLGVCGAVGSGKTSLIQAILGMMKKTEGTIAINEEKKIAYVSQQAWIMNATVKENIIFGHEFDQGRYDEVVEACALTSDFSQLPAGDQTEIGERGINLSGGQKQRVSIARAVYSDSDIILLDDPLSAVDAHVGQHIFQNCLKGLLKDKTILFVSHQLQFMTGCDYVLVMKDGRISEEGTHDVLMANENGEYSNLIKSFHDSEANEEVEGEDGLFTLGSKPNAGMKASTHSLTDPIDIDMSSTITRPMSMHSIMSGHSRRSKGLTELSQQGLDSIVADSVLDLTLTDESDDVTNVLIDGGDWNDKPSVTGTLTTTEGMESGAVKMATYSSYLKAAGGVCVVTWVFLIQALSTGCQGFTSYWLSYWINDGSGGYMVNETTEGGNYTLVLSENLLYNDKLELYQLVYGCSLVAVIVLALIKSVAYMTTSLNASSKLHDKVFRKLVASPMSFFDVTPSGRILNRFSKDMDEIDSQLPFMSEQFLNSACAAGINILLIALVFYYFLIAIVPLFLIFMAVYIFSSKAVGSMKRIENVTRSPLFSHVATTVQGLSTIRAYKKEDQFHREFNRLQDKNNMALLMFQMSNRWLGVRLDTFGLIIVLTTALCVTFVSSDIISPSYAALALTSAMNLTGMFQYTMRFAKDTEASFTSVERIHSYVENLESEAPAVVEGSRPDSSWPKDGAIAFNKVEMRYRDGLPLVLKGITLDISAQEKIGIVGRTGSGKSSIGMALFRMMELASGDITIDGVDISSIGLEDLRSKLSIIPQDPVLFVGTVRYNLDPFHSYTDDELWSALDKCHVKHTIKSLDGQLDAAIVENGENFSVGERQLLCMARALLRHSKILLLDEATAAIDTETDTLIQQTIKDAFVDCTMLTIAHRLNTVASSDRILVMDDGKVIEFDTPEKLLSDQESVFAQMMAVQESQKQQAMDVGQKSS